MTRYFYALPCVVALLGCSGDPKLTSQPAPAPNMLEAETMDAEVSYSAEDLAVATELASVMQALRSETATADYFEAQRQLRDRVRFGDEAVVTALRMGLHDRSTHVRIAGLSLLEPLLHSRADVLEEVADVLAHDAEQRVRTVAAEVLARSAPPSECVVRAAGARLRAGDHPLKLVFVLKRMAHHTASAAPELIAVLDDPDANTRWHAAAALSLAGDAASPAIPVLVAWLQSELVDERGRLAAVDVLSSIGPTASEAFDVVLLQLHAPISSEQKRRGFRDHVLQALASIGVPDDRRSEVLTIVLEELRHVRVGVGAVELLRRVVRAPDAECLLPEIEYAVQMGHAGAYRALLDTLMIFPERADAIESVERALVKGLPATGRESELVLDRGVTAGRPSASLAVRLVDWPEMRGPIMDALELADFESDMVNAVIDLADREPPRSHRVLHIASMLALRAAERGDRHDLPRLLRALARIEAVPLPQYFCSTGEPEESALDRCKRAVRRLDR